MEWIKLRSLRSTWWTLALTALGAVAIAAAVGANTEDGSRDLTNNALAGIAPGLLAIGVLGVLTATSEYTSGMIRLTLAAVPNRRRMAAAKAAMFGGVALAVGEATAFMAFLVGTAALPGSIDGPTLSDHGVLRAVVLAGVGFSLVGLLGLGLGLIFRHTPAAVAVLVGGVYVLAPTIVGLSVAVAGYFPVSLVANSLSTVQPMADMPAPWTGLVVLVGYTAASLAAGGWLLQRRDA
jgi:hypothetical protein